MGSSLENRYFLLRDESESRRLNLQHFVYKANIGYLLHPCIPIPSRTESRNEFHLADVGTGTGIWLFDISQSLPTSSHLSAFDISPSQFHVNRSLTPNITFIQHDLLKPFPSVHLQKYDVVHIRLMCLVLSKDEWAPAVQNIMTLLKPGGYLQWVDARLDNLKAYPIADNAATVYADRCKEIVDKATAAMNKDLSYPTRLLSTFRCCGLTECIEERIASDKDPSTRADLNQTAMVAFEEMCRILLAAGGMEGMRNKEQCDELLKGTYDELMDLKAVWRYEILLVVGKKALM